jgi:mannose-6-phosphate isomerase-like protein (cupin superfamily)
MSTRIIPKPWGQEEVIEINDRYMVKRLTMRAGHRCSLQYHHHKRETIYVLSGRLRIVSGDKVEALAERIYQPGESVTLATGVIHRMEGVDDTVYLESSTPEMDDVVRLKDDYARA